MKLILSIIVLAITMRLIDGSLYSGRECTMFDSSEGICTPLAHCNWALNQLRKRHIGFGGFSRCGFEGFSEIICCKKDPDSPSFRDPGKRKSEQACDLIKKIQYSDLSQHITNGLPVQMGEVPHQIAIGITDPVTRDIHYNCGGSLISRNFVLTAAHCLRSKIYRPTLITLGRIALDSKFELDDEEPSNIKIKRIVIHPNYGSSNSYNDIALIELAEPVPLTKNIHPACLHTDINGVEPNRHLQVTGWGTSGKFARISKKVLMKGTLSYVPNSYCNLYYDRIKMLPYGINPGQMCAFDKRSVHESKKVDACNGDSGKFFFFSFLMRFTKKNLIFL